MENWKKALKKESIQSPTETVVSKKEWPIGHLPKSANLDEEPTEKDKKNEGHKNTETKSNDDFDQWSVSWP